MGSEAEESVQSLYIVNRRNLTICVYETMDLLAHVTVRSNSGMAESGAQISPPSCTHTHTRSHMDSHSLAHTLLLSLSLPIHPSIHIPTSLILKCTLSHMLISLKSECDLLRKACHSLTDRLFSFLVAHGIMNCMP